MPCSALQFSWLCFYDQDDDSQVVSQFHGLPVWEIWRTQYKMVLTRMYDVFLRSYWEWSNRSPKRCFFKWVGLQHATSKMDKSMAFEPGWMQTSCDASPWSWSKLPLEMTVTVTSLENCLACMPPKKFLQAGHDSGLCFAYLPCIYIEESFFAAM